MTFSATVKANGHSLVHSPKPNNFFGQSLTRIGWVRTYPAIADANKSISFSLFILIPYDGPTITRVHQRSRAAGYPAPC